MQHINNTTIHSLTQTREPVPTLDSLEKEPSLPPLGDFAEKHKQGITEIMLLSERLCKDQEKRQNNLFVNCGRFAEKAGAPEPSQNEKGKQNKQPQQKC